MPENRWVFERMLTHTGVAGLSGRVEISRHYSSSRILVEEVGSLRSNFVGLSKNDDRRIIYVACFTSSFGAGSRGLVSFVKPGELDRSWMRLLDMINMEADIHLDIIPHPRYDDIKYYKSRILPLSRNVGLVYERADLSRRVYDVALLMNTPSSAAVDVVRSDIPIVYLRDVIPPWHKSDIDRGLICISEIDKLLPLLRRLKNDRMYRHRVLAQQRRWLDEVVCAFGKKAASNMEMFLEKIIEGTEKERPSEVHEGERWLLDMIRLVGYWNSGVRFLRSNLRNPNCAISMTREFWLLCRRGRKLHDIQVEGVRGDEIGKYILLCLLWGPKSKGVQKLLGKRPFILASRVAVLYFLLPSAVRPNFRFLRSVVVHAILESLHNGRLGVFSRLVALTAVCGLAPGRITRAVVARSSGRHSHEQDGV